MTRATAANDPVRGVLLRSRHGFIRTAQALGECAWRKAALHLAVALGLFALGTVALAIWLTYRLTADFIREFLAEGSGDRQGSIARGGSGRLGQHHNHAKDGKADSGVVGPASTPRDRTAGPTKPAKTTVELPEGAGVWQAGRHIYIECDNTGPMADALRKLGAQYDRDMGALWIDTAKAQQVIEILRRNRTVIQSGTSQGE